MTEPALDVEAIREEMASRVVYDPDCTKCERMGYGDMVRMFIKTPPDGYEHAWDSACFIKPCQTCRTRTPYAWIRTVPIGALREFMFKNQGTFHLDELKPLARTGFEFL